MNFFDIKQIEKRIFFYLCGFALFSSLSVFMGNIFLAFAIIGFFRRLYVKHDDWRCMVPKKGLLVAVAAIWAVVIISSLLSADIWRGMKIFFDHYLYRMMPFFIVLLCVREKKKLILLMGILVISIVINGMLGIGQSVINIGKYAGTHSGIIHYMMQATILTMTIPMLFVGCMRLDDRKWKLVSGVALVIAFVALIFNGRRGAWIALAAALPFISFLAVKSKVKWFLGMAVVVLMAVGIFCSSPALMSRFNSIDNAGEQSRVERFLLWRSSVMMFEDNPVLGVGPGQFGRMYREKYILPEAKERELGHAHNIFFNMFAECGAIGGIAFCLFWIYLVALSLYNYHRTKNLAYRAIFSAAMGIILHGMTEYTWGATLTMKFFWFVLGIAFAWINLTEKKETQFKGRLN